MICKALIAVRFLMNHDIDTELSLCLSTDSCEITGASHFSFGYCPLRQVTSLAFIVLG